ncbi:MAG: hypothetical protein ABII90_10205, partial [Bacteroidota bacterium]
MTIARSRKQRVFAVIEATKGTMVFPAAVNFIQPAGNAVMNQNPEFVDSMELSDTLDVLAQFENSLPPGAWTLPMYLRPSGTLLTVPQGSVLFQSLQGVKVEIRPELMTNQVDRDFSGASAWEDVDLAAGGGAYDETGDLTITAGVTGLADYCTCPVASMPTVIGFRYTMKFDVANLVGTWTIKDFTGVQTIGTVSAEGLQQELTWIATTTGGLRIVAAANSASADFDNFTLFATDVTAALVAEISAVAVTLDYKLLTGGIFPERGTLLIGTEQIHYTGITRSTATTGTMTGLTRGYNSTTAAIHAINIPIGVKHIFYRQSTDSPSFSLWVETDFFVQGMSGCSVNNASLSVTNDGAVLINFTGQGMKMVYAGNDVESIEAASGQKTITLTYPKRFSVGAYIWNETKEDSNSGAGYILDTINTTTGVC